VVLHIQVRQLFHGPEPLAPHVFVEMRRNHVFAGAYHLLETPFDGVPVGLNMVRANAHIGIVEVAQVERMSLKYWYHCTAVPDKTKIGLITVIRPSSGL